MGSKAMVHTDSQIWKMISGCDAPPPSYDKQSMGMGFGAAELPNDEASELVRIRRKLRELVRGGLSAQNRDGWFRYWFEHQGGRSRFRRLFNLEAALNELDDDDAEMVDEQRKHLIEYIVDRFPSVADVVSEAVDTMNRAMDMVHGLSRLNDSRREADEACARIIGPGAEWCNVAINSLLVACNEPHEPPLVSFFASFAHGAAKMVLDAATRAVALRQVAPTEHLALHASLAAAKDGFGFVASVKELEIFTSGAKHDEMTRLIASSIKGYFQAEKKRGGLGRVLAGLQMEGDLSALQIALFVEESGQTILSDVVNIPL